jgi:hypothetical protein
VPGTNKHGAPCGSTIVNKDGLCIAHDGQTNMRALGQKGGQKPPGAKAVQAAISKEDPLRGKARVRLDEMLDSPNEQIRMRAASTLFGYGVDRPESEQQRKGWQTKNAGIPTTVLAAHMAEILDIEPGRLNLLPSPGEVYDPPEAGDETP